MNRKNPGFSTLLLLIMVSFMVSCNPSKNTYSSDPQGSKARETSRILFLNYQISRDSTKTNYSAQLINTILKDGTIKVDQQHNDQAEINDLELLVLDRNQQIISHRYIPNPLDKSVEYVNNAGQFERKMIHLDSAQFSIRLQIEPGASSILLNRFIGNETEAKLLLKTPIL
jgi:hypothetical protein